MYSAYPTSLAKMKEELKYYTIYTFLAFYADRYWAYTAITRYM